MIYARRLKRNFRRFLLPFENALVWTAGPLALALYWMWHGALQGARLAVAAITQLRF
jgi:hypothetical protein